MNLARVLLLNCSPMGSLGKELDEILTLAPHPNIKLEIQTVDLDRAACRSIQVAQMIDSFKPHLCFLILSLNFLTEARKLLQLIRRKEKTIPVMMLLEKVQPDRIFKLLGDEIAVDFATAPLKEVDVLPRFWQLLKRGCVLEKTEPTVKQNLGLNCLIGQSPAFIREIDKVSLLSQVDETVLISGETGTGKELCARAVHYLSRRANMPFVPVNCGGIPVELIENELFGHQAGAFTGAVTAKSGLIQEADRGTLFLDELEGLPPTAQIKLLRFLQDGEYRALGSTKTLTADVRIIAATNTKIEEAIKAGLIRQDLFYRLSVIPIVLPPLRERPEDVLLLARHFLDQYAEIFKKPVSDFSAGAIRKLTLYQWPGNIRELENVVKRGILLSKSSEISSDGINLSQRDKPAYEESFQQVKHRVIETFEKNYIKELLTTYDGNVTKAAQSARKHRRALWQLIQKHHINVHNFKPRSS